jgi:hypothetical protein
MYIFGALGIFSLGATAKIRDRFTVVSASISGDFQSEEVSKKIRRRTSYFRCVGYWNGFGYWRSHGVYRQARERLYLLLRPLS